MTEINRCTWVGSDNRLMLEYHDREWGVPVHDDRKHFEFLVLEAAQASLGTAELKINGEDAKLVTGTGSRGSIDAIASALESTVKGELSRAHKLKDLPPRKTQDVKGGRDVATGQATGQRSHKPIIIV